MAQPTPATPALILSPDLSRKLRDHTEQTLLNIINTNSPTHYVRESPHMHDFHLALSALPVDHADSRKFDAFNATVPLTDYQSYDPFVSRFLQKPLKESQLKDLFSPGLPIFITRSSFTSGNTPKLFPKYHKYETRPANNDSPEGACTMCGVFSVHYLDILHVEGDDGQVMKNIPLCGVSSVIIRSRLGGLDVENDKTLMNATYPGATSIAAVYFIHEYRPFLLMHALFALRHRTLEMINAIFGTVFHDMIRFMVEEWDTLVDCIEYGRLPDYDGIDHVKKYLEPQMVPDQMRAAELRTIGLAVDSPGWLKKIWPSLDVVIAIVSGSFSSVIPDIRHFIGPDVRIRSLGFAASEAFIGTTYDDTNVNLFKATSDDVIEYLDPASGDGVGKLFPAWGVKAGKKYEVVITTRDGLWRYRMGDIISIEGFDPEDGTPLFEFVERQNVVMRLGHAATSEKQIIDAIRSTSNDTLGHLVEFTVMRDSRKPAATFGYLVEITGSPGSNAHLAVQQVLDNLSLSSATLRGCFAMGKILPPTIRIVQPGTFRDFRKWRIEELNVPAGQIKVPVVLPNPKLEEWFLEKVILEL